MTFWWGTAPPAHMDEPRLTITVLDIHFKGLFILTGDTTNVTVLKKCMSLTIVYFIHLINRPSRVKDFMNPRV